MEEMPELREVAEEKKEIGERKQRENRT